MFNINFTFEYPWLLTLLIPAIVISVIPYFRSAKKYRRNRNRIISLVTHTLALVLCVFLASGIVMHYEITNKSNQVILLVDSSYSNRQEQGEIDEFVKEVIEVADEGFKVGVVKFGYDQIYAAKLSTDLDEVYENYLEADTPLTYGTNLEAALKYTASLFDNPLSAKIVVISDGVETDGAALSAIKAIGASGIKVDVKCFPSEPVEDVQIVDVKLPDENIVPDEKFNLLVTLQVSRTFQNLDLLVYDNGTEIAKQAVSIDTSEQVEQIECVIPDSGMHEIRIVADVAAGETLNAVPENDSYVTYINIESYENILVIENNEGESSALCRILEESYNVDALSVEEDLDYFPSTIEEFCRYEQVVLVNIAYADMPAGFEALLNEYVQDLGGGLLTVGGENRTEGGKLVPHAYNRADVDSSTYFKQMLPVITENYTPPVAVMIIIDTSSSMGSGAGSALDGALDGARNCVELLSDRDYCGVVSFTTITDTVSDLLPVAKRQEIYNSINALEADASGGGTTYAEAIRLAGLALKQVDVERKHIIFISDGKPNGSADEDDYMKFVQSNRADGITLSTLGIRIPAGSAEEKVMKDMADEENGGGGKFYNASSADDVAQYMSADLRVEAIPEIDYGTEFELKIKADTHVTEGIDEKDLPTLSGYYGTTAKVGAEVALMGKYVPIYAEWAYGKGRVGSFMSDLNGTWSANFIGDHTGKIVINNIIKGLFPATAPTPKKIDYILSTDNCSNQLSIFGIDETDKIEVDIIPHNTSDGSYIEDVKVTALEGNRRFRFDIYQAGIYEISISRYAEDGELICQTVVYKTFSYSQEYNSFPTKEPIGEELLNAIKADGNGNVIEDVLTVYDGFLKRLSLEYDLRIPFLILAIILVLIDIAVRKFKFKWIHEIIRERKEKSSDGEYKKN